MPAWNDYKNMARERGALALELYVVQSNPIASPEKLQEVLPRHLAYQKEIEAEGKLFLAGPVSDLTGEQMQGNGLMVYRASSFEDAKKIADNDPMHKEGAREYILKKWLVNEGSPSFTTALSGQTVILS